LIAYRLIITPPPLVALQKSDHPTLRRTAHGLVGGYTILMRRGLSQSGTGLAMQTIPGYQITETLHTGDITSIYRGTKDNSQETVILKSLTIENPALKDIAHLQNEYELLKELDIPEVIQTKGLLKHHHRLYLILEDIQGAATLSALLKKQQFDVDQFFSIAIPLTKALQGLHREHIIHKDIKPSNILYSLKQKTIKIIDLGIASLLPRESQEAINPTALEGTLAYISPEQTGRMNRNIDYRSDFYSLGVTFYQILTGQLPFATSDPMELIHSHIAITPKTPKEINPDIPEILSELIMKLLSKNAENRYLSATGLLLDIKKCQKEWGEKGDIKAFKLGQKDIASSLQIPEKLYGRESEIKKSLNAFDNISGGSKQILMVAGYSGIGKTSLVKEIHKPIVKKRGMFFSGKFEQFKRQTPYLALIQSLRKLVKQLLSEPEKSLNTWKENILKELDPNGQVMIEIIPDLELIIGKQPPVEALSPAEAQNRFNRVFQQFIHCFAKESHPLVIFLDDMQWADNASLKLVEALLGDIQLKYFLLIGAYRDNEVNATHPLMIFLNDIKDINIEVDTLTLKPLDSNDVTQLVADSLLSQPKKVIPLADLVFKKTGGNPFFIDTFLDTLYKDKHINFNNEKRAWEWQISEIEALPITENVVELMTQRLKRLPEATQDLLKTGACIGSQFDLVTLATVIKQSKLNITKDIQPALTEGFIFPLELTYQREKGEEDTEVTTEQVNYKFQHDRVQQAAYDLIEKDQKKHVHLKIGRLLLESIPKEEREEKIFEIVNQLNVGVELLTSKKQKIQLAELNLQAGKKAKAATAYQPSFGYLSMGINLLDKKIWENNYDLALQLHVEAADAAYLIPDFDEMERLGKIVLHHAKNLLDAIQIYEIRISAYALSARAMDAIYTGIEVLNLLGVKLPKKPNTMHIITGLIRLRLAFLRKPVDSLIDLPKMNNPYMLAAMRIMVSISAVTYFALPNLLALMCLRMATISMKYGNCEYSGNGYAACIILFWVVNDMETTRKLGELALKVAEKFQVRREQAYTLIAVGTYKYPWFGQLEDAWSIIFDGYQAALETGNHEYGGYGTIMYSMYRFHQGHNLKSIETQTAQFNLQVKQLKQPPSHRMNAALLQLCANLQGKAKDPTMLIGDYFDESKQLKLILDLKETCSYSHVCVYKMMVCYHFNNYPEGIKFAKMVIFEPMAAIATCAINNMWKQLMLLI